MFDLDQHIESWRGTAADLLGGDGDLLDELECHLRDEFDRLTASGQAAGQAWDAAVRRLGESKDLADEFAKLRRRHWAPAWVVAGLLAIFAPWICWFSFGRFAEGKTTLLLAVHVVLISVGYMAVFGIGFLGLSATIIRTARGWNRHTDSAFRTSGRRLALLVLIVTAPGTILGAWWAHDNLGRWWGWDARETGALCVLAWAFVSLWLFGRRGSASAARMAAATIGNMVVALAWFGPLMLGGPHAHRLRPALVGLLLGGFLIMQILAISLLILPKSAFARYAKKLPR